MDTLKFSLSVPHLQSLSYHCWIPCHDDHADFNPYSMIKVNLVTSPFVEKCNHFLWMIYCEATGCEWLFNGSGQ